MLTFHKVCGPVGVVCSRIFTQGLNDVILPNPLRTFYAPTQHSVVFISAKVTLQMMMAYE